jgi:hypothetical protein
MSTSGPLEFSWKLNRTDHYDLLRSTVATVRFAPWFGAAFVLAAIPLLLVGLWLPASFGLLVAVVVVLLPRWQAGVSARDYPLADKEIRARADTHKLTLDAGQNAHSEIDWPAVQRWSDTGRTIVLRTSDNAGGYPIPRRAFAGSADAEAFTELLRSEVGRAGRPRREGGKTVA